jgi:hypothetical protein
MDGHLLDKLVDQTIVDEGNPSCQSGEFYFAIFGDFIIAIDIRPLGSVIAGNYPYRLTPSWPGYGNAGN